MNAQKMVADWLAGRPAIQSLGVQVYWNESPKTVNEDHYRVNLASEGRFHNLTYAVPEVQVSAFSRDKTRVNELKETAISELRNAKATMGSSWVVSVITDSRTFKDNTWWHAPATFRLRLLEG